MIQEETKKTGPKPHVEKNKQAKGKQAKKIGKTYFDLNINLTGSKVIHMNKKTKGLPRGVARVVQIHMEKNTEMTGPDVILIAHLENHRAGSLISGSRHFTKIDVESVYKDIMTTINSCWRKGISDYTGIEDGNFALVGKGGTEFPLSVNKGIEFFEFKNKDIVVNLVSKGSVIPDPVTHDCMECKEVFDEYAIPVEHNKTGMKTFHKTAETRLHVSGICVECCKSRCFKVHDLPMLVECSFCAKDISSFYAVNKSGKIEHSWEFGDMCCCSDCYESHLVPRIGSIPSSVLVADTLYDGRYSIYARYV